MKIHDTLPAPGLSDAPIDHADHGDKCDITIEWSWQSQRDKDDDIFFEISIFSSDDDRRYTPGAFPNNAVTTQVQGHARCLLLPHLSRDLFYSFAIRAVGVRLDELRTSPWVCSSHNHYHPYHPAEITKMRMGEMIPKDLVMEAVQPLTVDQVQAIGEWQEFERLASIEDRLVDYVHETSIAGQTCRARAQAFRILAEQAHKRTGIS